MAITPYVPAIFALPNETLEGVCLFLRGTGSENDDQEGDKVIMRTEGVCREWRDNGLLNEEREGASKRLRGITEVLNDYDQDLVRLFRECGLSIALLKGLPSEVDPIDAFYQTMERPVMRFKGKGKQGIILTLTPRNNPLGIAAVAVIISRNWIPGASKKPSRLSFNDWSVRVLKPHFLNFYELPNSIIHPTLTQHLRDFLTDQDPNYALVGMEEPQGPVLPPRPLCGPCPSARDLLLTVSAAVVTAVFLVALEHYGII